MSALSLVQYSPPWRDMSIIGIAGSSGSGKTSLSRAIVSALSLPWVVILPMDSFYKALNPEAHRKAHLNEYDFDAPEAVDFDLLLDVLIQLKQGKRAEIPIYSFSKHQREKETTSIYSPHVLILEGIFALHDPRILALMDMRVFCEADADTCLSRRRGYSIHHCDLFALILGKVLRDLKERDRDIEGCIKQWFTFVKPNFEKYVHPQSKVADIIVPRGVENVVAITMVTQYIERKLVEKSKSHCAKLNELGNDALGEPVSPNILLLEQIPQIRGMNTIIQDATTSTEDFIFYFDRLAAVLVEHAMNNSNFKPVTVETSAANKYQGLKASGETSAVTILRAGSALETGLKRVIPDCRTGRMLIQSHSKTGEPELHYLNLPDNIADHDSVLLLDPQMSSGGAALMAVQVLVDHGVSEDKIVFITYFAGKLGVKRLIKAFPKVKVVGCIVVADSEERWLERRYFGC